MKNSLKPIAVNSVSALHQLAGLEKPLHSKWSLIRFNGLKVPAHLIDTKVILNLYSIFLKKKIKGKLKYGQSHYDFDEGVMGMTAPGQLMGIQDQYEAEGWWLVFHSDFIQSYPISQSISKFGFFAYDVMEALHLSIQEEAFIEHIFNHFDIEQKTPIDEYSQDVLISNIALLFNYARRFYARQFVSRKIINEAIVIKFENALNDYFNTEHYEHNGLANVQYFSNMLNVSSHYLSDMLRKYTGQNTQQHIHNKLIEKAKEKLSASELTINEIAFLLGFEHAQSFSKLFKNKTGISPLAFRQSFE